MNKHKNYRRCVSCRQVKEKNLFLQVVRTFPSHQISLTNGMGRSAYICPNKECVLIAQKQKRLSKALKTPIPHYVYEQIWQELSQTLTKKND